MFNISIIGAFTAPADGGRGRSDSIGGSPAPSSNFSTPSPATRTNFAAPSSAFFTPSDNRSPPSHHEIMMKHTAQALRSSPTSVTTAMFFDGGLCDLPYEDMNSSPVDRQASLVMRQSDHYYASPAASHHQAREAPLESPREFFQTPPRGVAETAAVCLPCTPASGTARQPRPVEATTRNTDSAKFNSPSPTSSGGRRSSNHGPSISAGDGGERPPLPSSGGGNISGSYPTPQNLRDNPERQAKVKTEMCHYYDESGAKKCPWGANCNYAHGKHELKFRYTTLCLMEGSGLIANAKTYLARPCMTWVSTGACPFGRRCAAIHDPSISGTLECPSWLPAASAKTNAQIIVDRFAAHRESVVHQENPLIDQSIWENCRPSHRGRHKERARSGSGDDANKSILDMEQKWSDTYALVCNSVVSVFTGGRPAYTPSKTLSDLQKLCIVRLMRGSDGLFQQESNSSQLHRDYVFSPTHSLRSELCMILQDRYFLLLEVNFTSTSELSPEDVVKEISFDAYKSRTTPWSSKEHRFDPSKCVTAHEVAFAPKGDHSANVSIWFDALPVKLEQSQIKRSRRLKQKKKAQIRNDHTRPNANGALISRTSSADFPTGPPDIDPFVPMLPAEDNDEIHCLIVAIMEHHIESIILSNCSFVNEEQKKNLHLRKKQLQKNFMGMEKFHEKWTWPKREGMGHVTVTTRAPPGNIMPYIPLKNNKKNPCLHTWHTFVESIGMLNTHAVHSSANDDSKRLSVFLSFDGSSRKASLPHIISYEGGRWNADASSSPKKDGTWKEILLGLPENGRWESALRLHNKKRGGSIDNTISKVRNMPLSTIPFVQA